MYTFIKCYLSDRAQKKADASEKWHAFVLKGRDINDEREALDLAAKSAVVQIPTDLKELKSEMREIKLLLEQITREK